MTPKKKPHRHKWRLYVSAMGCDAGEIYGICDDPECEKTKDTKQIERIVNRYAQPKQKVKR